MRPYERTIQMTYRDHSGFKDLSYNIPVHMITVLLSGNTFKPLNHTAFLVDI